MSLIEEFKKFALKGNVVDLAVGVVIGGAFGRIVTTMVDKIIMPPIGMAIDNVNFSHLKIVLQKATEGHPEVAIGYGAFIQEIVNFLIVAWSIFFVIKTMNSLQRKKEEAPPAPAAPPEDVLLLREIRDLLQK